MKYSLIPVGKSRKEEPVILNGARLLTSESFHKPEHGTICLVPTGYSLEMENCTYILYPHPKLIWMGLELMQPSWEDTKELVLPIRWAMNIPIVEMGRPPSPQITQKSFKFVHQYQQKNYTVYRIRTPYAPEITPGMELAYVQFIPLMDKFIEVSQYAKAD